MTPRQRTALAAPCARARDTLSAVFWSTERDGHDAYTAILSVNK